MIPAGEPLPAGYCQHCRIECRDCTGAELWPSRPDLAEKIVWRCMQCGARVGSHDASGKPLGTAANEELRRAREILHGKLDPIWKNAHRDPAYAAPRDGEAGQRDDRKRLAIIKRTARSRVYAYLADRLGLTKDECHVAMFDLERCREAWRVIVRLTYAEVREWAQAEKEKAARE